MITYEEFPNLIKVKLEGKLVGHIEYVGKGYQYKPKGQKTGGDVFSTLVAVKKSLEN